MPATDYAAMMRMRSTPRWCSDRSEVGCEVNTGSTVYCYSRLHCMERRPWSSSHTFNCYTTAENLQSFRRATVQPPTHTQSQQATHSSA